MHHEELTEKDLSVYEKKVMGKLIDLWAAGADKYPYGDGTEAKLLGRSEGDGLSRDLVLGALKSLEAKGLIRRAMEKGELHIKYQVKAAHIVKELQKTDYIYGTTEFKPPHH